MISIIVAKSLNNVIGSRNDLPWHLPADQKYFRDITRGQTVVMGTKTFDSIIAGLNKPLPDRKNIVITRDRTFAYTDVEVIHDIESIKQLGDVFVIGGAEIYRQTIDFADKLYVTEIDVVVDGDAYFPEINDAWHEVSRETHKADDKNQYDYDFVVYERRG
ncbi:MAG: dihydrofolate reductase [Candidatus Saccharimonadales bacterium]